MRILPAKTGLPKPARRSLPLQQETFHRMLVHSGYMKNAYDQVKFKEFCLSNLRSNNH